MDFLKKPVTTKVVQPPLSAETVAEWRKEFPVLSKVNSLANCSQVPQSRKSRAAIESYLDNWATVGQVWLAHEKWGTQVDYIPLSHGQIDLEEYRKRVNENTLLVPATHVYYQNGFKQDSQGFTFIDPQRNILITPGSDSGLFYAMFPFLEPGDEVLIPDPSYPNNTQNATLMGAVAVHVPLRPEDGYRLPVEEFRRLCTDRTKMVVLTNPNNPTSTVFSKAEISELCRLIDGTGAPAVEQGYLLVENGMIRSIGAIQDLQDRRKPESTQPDCAQPDGNRGTFPESGWSLSP